LRSRIFPAISINKDVIIISDWSPPVEPMNPEGTQEWGKKKKKRNCHLVTIRLQLLPEVSPKETQDVKTQELVPVAEIYISKE